MKVSIVNGAGNRPVGLPLARRMPFLERVFSFFQTQSSKEASLPVVVDSVNEPDAVSQPRKSHLNASVFVWSVWVIALFGCLLLIVKYGSSAPFWDEWLDTVPMLTGEQPLTLQRLWKPHNEHRILLPRLIELGLLKLSAGDFRAGMIFDVSVLAFFAALFILAAKRLRGWTTYSDAFFPLAMLQLGQWENLLWGFQVAFIWPIALVYLLLLVAFRDTQPVSLTKGILAGLSFLLLTLSGAIGIAVAPALAVWFSYLCIRGWRSGQPRSKLYSGMTLGFLLATLVIILFQLVGYERTPHHAASPGGWASVRTALQMASMCFGPGSVHFWPVTGMIILALLLMTAGLALFVYRRQPEERPRLVGVLALLAALSCLVLVTGWGRAFIGPTAGFASRYVTLVLPVFCCVYLVWGLYGGTNTGRTVQMCLFSLACAFYLPNVENAIEIGRSRRQRFTAFEQELLAGVNSRSLSERHAAFLLNDKGFLDVQMRNLHHAGIGVFRHLNPFSSRATNLDPNPYSFAMMRTPPILAQSEISVGMGFCEDRNVLGVHPPGEIHFQLPRGSKCILGEFGIAPGAYEQGQTDGVLFTVECLSDNSTPAILYERHLDPVHESRDRGLQTFRIHVPESMEGRLIFRTSNLPGHNISWDWSYWTGIEIQ